MQDLLRYDDYNNDGHLTLQELYTAFRESQRRLAHHHPSVQISLSRHVANLQISLLCPQRARHHYASLRSTFAVKRAPDPLGQ